MGQALTEREIEALVREVTDEEVAFYHEYGWVMMKQLVDRDFATELLSIGQAWLEREGEEKGRQRRAVGPGAAGRDRAVSLVHVQRAHVKERDATREQEAA